VTSDNPRENTEMAEQGFTLTSPFFREGAFIPRSHAHDGDDFSPRLDWMHPPKGTRSFVLTVESADAHPHPMTHWVLFNIPAVAASLPQRAANAGVPGRNDFQKDGYTGPFPPANHGDHRYFFTLSALDVDSLPLEKGARREEVERAMDGHVLGSTRLMGRYKRGATGQHASHSQ
jgi:Raf kinase inhibitor-like YbhB/YbcL family protein